MKIQKPLKTKQQAALKLLAQGESQKNVAIILKVSSMTVFRWFHLPEFKAQLNTLTSEETGLAAIARMANVAGLTALENCQEILASVYEPAEVRLKAAQIILRGLPSINAAMERGMKHHRADFLLQERWDKGDTYDCAGKLIEQCRVSAEDYVRTATGGVLV